MSKPTTYTTPILDEEYTVRTVITEDEGVTYSRVFITNNDNGLVLGGEGSRKPLTEDNAGVFHRQTVESAVMSLAPRNWVHRVNSGETTVHNKK